MLHSSGKLKEYQYFDIPLEVAATFPKNSGGLMTMTICPPKPRSGKNFGLLPLSLTLGFVGSSFNLHFRKYFALLLADVKILFQLSTLGRDVALSQYPRALY